MLEWLVITLGLLFSHSGNMQTIYESTNVPYNEHMFTNCNPCPLVLEVDNEINGLYQDINFTMNVDYSTPTGYSGVCIDIYPTLSSRGWAAPPCTFYRTPEAMCRDLGYAGKGVNPEGSWGSCNQCQLACYNTVITSTEWIEVRHGNTLLHRFDGENQADVNFASSINEDCGSELYNGQICQSAYSVSSSNNGGSWYISNVPVDIRLVPSSTTTTTTTYGTPPTTTITFPMQTTTTVSGATTTTTTIGNTGDITSSSIWIWLIIVIIIIGLAMIK